MIEDLADAVKASHGVRQYSDVTIETALTLRLLFHLPLRQTEGLLTSLFRLMNIDRAAPDHTTLSRRGQHLDLASVTGDAAYDTLAFYDAAGARLSTEPAVHARDRTINKVKQIGRRRWKKVSGYHRQAGVENAFFRYKSIIGEGLRARSPDGQGAEAVIACHVLNRMTELGRPESYRIGC